MSGLFSEEWMKDGFGLARLGVTVASGKLKCVVADHRRMVRTPVWSALRPSGAGLRGRPPPLR